MRVIVAVLLLFPAVFADAGWFRGNLHTHTLESDGDSTPAVVAKWYADHGYHFLVITDHDKVTRLESNEILLILGEEITDRLPKKPLHVNAIGIETAIPPQKGATPVENLQRNIDAVRKAGGLALINHPNFGWAFGTDELLQIEGATLLEIASGHPYVNMLGRPSVESMWDDLLTAGKAIWGVAVDDSHHLERPWDTDVALPGKAWVVVRAERLERQAILSALAKGDFYASTGVELLDYAVDHTSICVNVKEKNLARYVIQFIGANGRILQQSDGPNAVYRFKGREAYVRAKVIDSNGRIAWLQPVMFARSRASSDAQDARPRRRSPSRPRRHP
jgi:hypothetical protein